MVEPRVYFDDNGKIICYTCEELDGNFITIDAKTYAISDPSLMVVNNELVKREPTVITRKLEPSDSGVKTCKENVAIVVSDSYEGKTTTWELKEYEYKFN